MKLLPSSSRFFVFAYIICINGVFSKFESEDSYSEHCSSLIPPYNITARSDGDSLPSLSTSYFTGGDRFQRNEPDPTYNYLSKNLRLRLRSDHYQTTAAGVYKVEGFLHISFANGYDGAPGGRAPLRFPMNGFWSENSRMLCMVGSASWEAIDFDAVLKLKFDYENPTIFTSVVSGSLQSTASANAPSYFDPVLIFDFPASVADYSYSLVSEGIGAVLPNRKGESLSLDSTEFCAVMEQGLMSLELGYAAECAEMRRRRRRRPHHCSPIGSNDESLPNSLSLSSIQCPKGAKKARFLATFRNSSDYSYDNFAFSSTVIGEAWWDGKNNRIIAVACPILNPSLQFGNSVGDCSMRLSLRQPSTLTMRNDGIILGEIWSSKAVVDSGYFRSAILTVVDENGAAALPERRYEYTEMGRARKWCRKKKVSAKKKGNVYPNAQSYDMKFNMEVRNGHGQNTASAYATPVWVENDLFRSGSNLLYKNGSTSSPTRMSYKIRIQPSFYRLDYAKNVSTPSIDWPVINPSGGLEMTAEGEYVAETGHLCMVGCRKLLLQNSASAFKDCEIVVELNLPMLNGESSHLAKGIVRSTRRRRDPLHFDHLVIDSGAYDQEEAKRSIWRMNFEIAMVLISNALVCIFVALQILHVKRNPEAASFVSLVMVVILCAEHMIPLVLSFEAVLLGHRDERTLELGGGGGLEANEVVARAITLVILLLQLCLLQLVCLAKQRRNLWTREKRAGFVSFSFYIIGGLLTLVLEKTYSVWGELRTYGGVILDGFLLPQVVLNMAKGSGLATKALCRSFYVGTSAVRLAPHVYNQYRSRNYPEYDMDSAYYYANAALELYSSTAWDIILPCGIIAFAVIVFLQQRKGVLRKCLKVDNIFIEEN